MICAAFQKAAFPAPGVGFSRTFLCVIMNQGIETLTNSLDTRSLLRADLSFVTTIVDATGLFPSELLADMAEPFLSGLASHSWLVICDGQAIIGFAYSEPERMTDDTHNLLAIAVLPDRQDRGVGKQLVAAMTNRLVENGGRILLVETSSLDEYEGARAFYDTQGFAREAIIRDYYATGEDKIIFWTRL